MRKRSTDGKYEGGCRNYQEYKNSLKRKGLAIEIEDRSRQQTNDENMKPIATQPTVSSVDDKSEERGGYNQITLTKCRHCHGSGWNSKYNMPCQNCNEVPSLKELRTPRTTTQNAKFLKDLNSSEFKQSRANGASITPRALANILKFSDNNAALM